MQGSSWKARSLVVVALLALMGSGCAFTQRVSVDSAGHQGDIFSVDGTLSADGRYVAFDSLATNLVAGDTNGANDVFVRDIAAGTTTRVSVTNAGAQAAGDSLQPVISANGRFIAFYSLASNLVAGDTNGQADVFVRDTVAGTTTRVSVTNAGAQATGGSSDKSAISADGRYVAFDSHASNLVTGDTNNQADVFVRDTVAGTTTRVSVAGGGAQANDSSQFPAISADGRDISFQSDATNLVTGDTNGAADVFVRDTVAGTTTRVSVGNGGTQADGGSDFSALSADGHLVTFSSDATNLVGGDTNAQRDVFVRDTVAGTTTRVSVDSAGNQTPGDSAVPSISADGRYVAFQYNTDLVPGHTNDPIVVLVRDTVGGTTSKVSVDTGGHDANAESVRPSISADGRYIAFMSEATNLVTGDTNNEADVFVRANPQPAVTSVAPSALAHGVATPVTITGAGFIPGALVVVDGPGTSVSGVTVLTPSTITATVTVDAAAPLSTRNVWVELPGTGPGVTAGAMGVCVGCASVT